MLASAEETSRPMLRVSREQVLAYRFTAQQLDREPSERALDADVLDIGVQDTGSDGALWALVNRGVDIEGADEPENDLIWAWTLRGAPHVYRRADIAAVAAATAPYSSADAGKRIFDAARPLRAAGIDPGDALDEIAGHLREIIVQPTVKGELSRKLTARLNAPYLRDCRPCGAVHAYEQPFRLAALRAGLELQPGTSPPVLQAIPGWRGPAAEVPARLNVVRAYLRLLGPATPKHVAGYLDAPVSEVKAHWPPDVAAVDVDDERRWLLTADVDRLRAATVAPPALRLLSPFDLFLQARDREVLVPEAAHRKLLWPVLGRPGAVNRGGQIVGAWRPRTTGGKLRLAVQTWRDVPERELAEQAERLATHRGVSFAGVISAD
jgi:DNA glycosylase AlkZ-like